MIMWTWQAQQDQEDHVHQEQKVIIDHISFNTSS